MGRVFLIPGLGADTRIYKNIDLQGHEVAPVNWIDPDENDTLTTYAQKLMDAYRISTGSIVIGNSLGGMIAIEIAKKVNLSKIILISSIKTVEEAPSYFKVFRRFKFYKLVPVQKLSSFDFLMGLVFGDMVDADQKLFADMLKKLRRFLLNGL